MWCETLGDLSAFSYGAFNRPYNFNNEPGK